MKWDQMMIQIQDNERLKSNEQLEQKRDTVDKKEDSVREPDIFPDTTMNDEQMKIENDINNDNVNKKYIDITSNNLNEDFHKKPFIKMKPKTFLNLKNKKRQKIKWQTFKL